MTQNVGGGKNIILTGVGINLINSDITVTGGGVTTGNLTINGNTILPLFTSTPPDSTSPGTPGTLMMNNNGGSAYLYYCIASGNWVRSLFVTYV